MPIQLWKI